MKNIFLLLIIGLLAFSMPYSAEAQIDASQTPSWLQNIKKKGLNEFSHSDLSPTKQPLILQGKQWNSVTEKWEWVKTNSDSLYANVPDLDPTGAVMSAKYRDNSTFYLGDYDAFVLALNKPEWVGDIPNLDDKLRIYSDGGQLMLAPSYMLSQSVNSNNTLQKQNDSYNASSPHSNIEYNQVFYTDTTIAITTSWKNQFTFLPFDQKLDWKRGRVSVNGNFADSYGHEWFNYANTKINSYKLWTTPVSDVMTVSFGIDTLGKWYNKNYSDSRPIFENGVMVEKTEMEYIAIPTPTVTPTSSTDMSGALANIPVGWTGTATIGGVECILKKIDANTWGRVNYATSW